MVHNDILGTAALMAFCAFTFTINVPLSIGFLIGGLVDSNFFTYGMIGCGVCGGVALACVLPWVVLSAVECAKKSAREHAEKERKELKAHRKEQYKSFVKSLYENKESNTTAFEGNAQSFEDRMKNLEERRQNSFY